MTGFLFALVGLATGVVQARLLVGSAGGKPHPLAALGRIALVGFVLLVAARAGHLLVGAAGWAAGFFVASALSYRRLR